MDAITLSSKYSPKNKPSKVYTNTKSKVNIAFKKSEQQLTNANILAEGKKLECQLVNIGKINLMKKRLYYLRLKFIRK